MTTSCVQYNVGAVATLMRGVAALWYTYTYHENKVRIILTDLKSMSLNYTSARGQYS